MMSLLRRASMLCGLTFLAFSLSACGGGGGGNGSTSSLGNGQAPSVTYPGSPATYTIGEAIKNPLQPDTSGGGPVTSYAMSLVTPLPAGLTLNTTTGDITGTPTKITSKASYTVEATNASGTTSTPITITVIDISPTSLSYGSKPWVYTAGTAITANQPSNSGGTVTSYAIAKTSPALPAGLSLDPQNGDITGTPTTVTPAANYTVVATNSGGSTSATFSIAVDGSVGGTVSGLVGTGLTLQDNNGDNLTLSANGSFTFATPLSYGANYTVTVLMPPSSHPVQTCSVSYGAGIMASFNVKSVSVVCSFWTWEGGASTPGATGVYPTSYPGSGTPGARSGATSWTDSSGRLWLFGGSNSSDSFNDIWMYDPSTGIWTWEGGSDKVDTAGIYSSSVGTVSPGARGGAISWTDSSGRFWLFGGIGYDSTGALGNLNDLWMYDPTSKTWTWEGGSKTINAAGTYPPTNAPGIGTPGSRSSAYSWTDSSGRFWLFGGNGYDSTGALGSLNDLWMYDPSSNTWTWEGGSKTINAFGTYPTSAPGIGIPGARSGDTSWTDSSGRFWLFGGYGYASTATGLSKFGYLNDLWMYDPSSNTWTWEGGSDKTDALGSYPSSVGGTGIPGSLSGALSWTDSNGRFWLFGGSGLVATDLTNALNDLWVYDPTSKVWTWEGGVYSPSAYAVGTYPANTGEAGMPGGRGGAVGWIDSSGQLWMFGGDALFGSSYIASPNYTNDMWRLQP